ncbi:MAG: hypothetical protein ACK5Z2_19250 [Bacteroidota bacterium]
MAKFQFSDKKDKLSDEQISSRMDFNQFLANRPQPVKFWTKAMKTVTVTAAAASVLTASYFLLPSDQSLDTNSEYVPFVQPLIKNLNTENTSYIVNTFSDTMVLSSKGSELIIPKATFVHANGQLVTGKVELRYREFHKPLEIMLSGIPMHYDSAGYRWTFESAGMFEITAFQDGKPVQIAPGKEITVNMISANSENDFNIYFLDTVKRRWEYIAENTRESNTCSEPLFIVNKEQEVKYKALVDDPAFAAPVKPDVADPDAISFSIDYVSSEFPELKAFDNIKFEPLPNEKEFSEKMAAQIWENVQIERSETVGIYKISLSSNNVTHNFKAKAVADAKNYDEAVREFERRDLIYQAGLLDRQQKIKAARDSMYVLNNQLTGNAERISYNDKFNAFMSGDYSNYPKTNLVYRTLAVARLGIWNSDRPRTFFDGFGDKIKAGAANFLFSAVFIDVIKKKIKLKAAYLVKRDVNSAFLVSADKFESQFPYIAGDVDKVIGVTEDDKICYCSFADLNKVKITGKTLEFIMTIPKEEINTVMQLDSLINK